MSFLSPKELARLSSAESLFLSPIPVRSVSSDEFMPAPQTSRWHEFEVRIKEARGCRLEKLPSADTQTLRHLCTWGRKALGLLIEAPVCSLITQLPQALPQPGLDKTKTSCNP